MNGNYQVSAIKVLYKFIGFRDEY